ncbi:RNA polymerase recycling motor HelD [Cohnella sp. 56]|uniref:RNA polymerase recycling motor HelD n=1 Tax=Cohnella sp. 56 TaxID=3113722 RepID=UPI0030E7FCFA
MEAKDWLQEQERLVEVRSKLQARAAKLEPEVTGLRDQAADLRKRFWEELTINTSTTDDFEDSFYAVQQQSALLAERERGHSRLVRQWNGIKRLLPSPYFGRVDFEEDGLNAGERIYIGVSSFVDEDGLNFLIYDWRSPIASLYYDYPPGRASYDTPGGRIEGTMSLKRQFQIQDGQIRNMFDASDTIGDELLQEVLGKDADSQMKSIVATIQKEQNAIIRDDTSRMLIVQGAAGSGKTSAALQRVAYLLYKHRQTIRADQIVLFSPNSMFSSYISTVLPELGEENMQQTTFQEYVDYWLGSALRPEDPFDQIEYTLTAQREPGYEARLQGIAYKTSEAYLKALQNYGAWLGQNGMRFKDIRYRDRVLIEAERMSAKLYEFDSSLPLAGRVALLQDWLLEELASLERQERHAPWVQEELNYLDNDQYAEVFGQLHTERELLDLSELYAKTREHMTNRRRGDEGDVDFARREEELILRTIVKESFRPLRKGVRNCLFVDIDALYGQLFDGDDAAYREKTKESAVPPLWAEICRQTKEKLGRSEQLCEDAAPYLFVKELISGARTNKEVRHVFVDEGQDYSAFQYAYLKKLFPRARMTVLGDFGQAIFMQATSLDAADSPLISLYGAADTRLVRLLRSYRSTSEIVMFTRALLPGGEEIVPFDRFGVKPRLNESDGVQTRDAQMLADIASLKAEGFASIAVVTKTAAESRAACASLVGKGGEGQLITKETAAFEKGVMVIPVYLAKGIEFDAVLIYDASPDSYGREAERKLLYTACTRAMHRLHLYTAGVWSPFLQTLPADLYELAR